MYQYLFMHCNKCTMLMQMLVIEETALGRRETGGMWEFSVFLLHFSVNLKPLFYKFINLKSTELVFLR